MCEAPPADRDTRRQVHAGSDTAGQGESSDGRHRGPEGLRIASGGRNETIESARSARPSCGRCHFPDRAGLRHRRFRFRLRLLSSDRSRGRLCGACSGRHRAGAIMGFGGVVVIADGITSLAALPRSCRREDIDRIDIVRSDFRHLQRVLPVAVLKDSSSIMLVPLAWPYSGRFPGSSNADLSLGHQAMLVREIRNTLSVQGADYTSTM